MRRDPFAMLPFCGYHMGDYFAHWLKIGASAQDAAKLPKIFYVSWFRKGSDGKFLWPGFGDNIRVLAWIFDRLRGSGEARDTLIGRVPVSQALDLSGVSIADDCLGVLLAVDHDEWVTEYPRIVEHYARYGDRLASQLQGQLHALKLRLDAQ